MTARRAAAHVRGVALALVTGLGVTLGVAACSDGGGATGGEVGVATTGSTAPTAGPGTGDLLVTGRVLDGGAPLAGAEVNVLVYPARPDPAATEPTQAVEVTPVTTDASGTYAVTLPPDEVPGEYLAPLPDGAPRLEFAVVADDGARVSSWSEIAALVAAGGSSTDRVWRTPEATGADTVLRVDLDLGARSVIVTDSLGGVERETLPSR